MRSAMDLAAIFKECNVQATFADKILESGWTAELFSMMNFDQDLEEVLEETSGALTPLQRAGLKLAWTKCKSPSSPPSGPVPPAPASSSASPDHAPTWTETFAPKLTSTTVASLKAKFKADYPAEILTLDTTPSLRLLSMVHHQHSKGDHKWIAWQFRLSQSRADDITSSKSQRVPKSESMMLHSMLLDDPPILEIQNGGLGLHTLRSLFETFSVAMAMVGVAHLASLKEYYLKVLSFMSQKMDPESGLRTPSILEAQAADKALMTTVCDLVCERKWSWDDALYEITHIRADMGSLLQPRPRLPRAPGPGKGDPPRVVRATPYGKGKGDGKFDKGKGKGKGGKANRVQWITEISHNGQRRALCMRFQTNKCTLGDSCKFHHGCAYPLPDGRACNKNHGAAQHEHTAH